jgi:hypothetical protein
MGWKERREERKKKREREKSESAREKTAKNRLVDLIREFVLFIVSKFRK